MICTSKNVYLWGCIEMGGASPILVLYMSIPLARFVLCYEKRANACALAL